MARNEKPEIFTDDEIDRFRADIDSTRVSGAYEPGRWSVSPQNRDPLVVGQQPTSIRLRDVTLRAIEALPGVVISPEAKATFLRQLVETGVPEVVTAGVRGRTVEELRLDLDLIRSANPDCLTTCPLVITAEDLEAPAGAGYDCVQIWVPPWGEASRIYESVVHASAWSGKEWRRGDLPSDRAGFLNRAAQLTTRARDLGLRVTAPLLMVSFLTSDRLDEACGVLAEAGASEIALFDGPGALGPEAYGALVARVRAQLPNVEIGVHPHNSFGLAVANAVSAAHSGADAIEVSVNGYCGGPGNADLASAVAAFEALYGVRTGVVPKYLRALSLAGMELTGYHVSYNHPITGDKAFNWGGMDFMTQESTVDELLHNCISPSWAGNSLQTPLTEASGPFTLWDKLTELSLNVTPGQVTEALSTCRSEMARLRRLLDDSEIRAIALSHGAMASERSEA